MVNTVINNYEGSKSAEINRADEVYKTLEHFGNPTVDDFDKMVCDNQIQKCPIISKGITSAKVIFGPYLVEVRGKTVRRKPKRVDSDSVQISRGFQLLHTSVTLVANVLFVNGIPFLITISRNLRFVNVKYIQYRTANQLIRSLNKFYSIYT